MQEDWHTVSTANEIIVRPMFFGSYRPKIWHRRCKDEKAKLAIRTYDRNRGSHAAPRALELLKIALGDE